MTIITHRFSSEPSVDGKSDTKGPVKDAGMIILKIKRIKRVDGRPANPLQPIPSVLGKRKVGDLCIGYVLCHYPFTLGLILALLPRHKLRRRSQSLYTAPYHMGSSTA